MDVKDKTVTVIGFGNSGLNAATLLVNLGARVKVTDSLDTPDVRRNLEKLAGRDVKAEIGKHTKDFIKGSELGIVSPGVDGSSCAIKWAREFNIPIISEMELGFRFCRGKIIAITGTNGKSTVTTLVGEILKKGGMDTVVCGNIGNSICGEIDRIREDTWVVLEVSSFQLERIEKFKPHIAVILNITDDHLDRYDSFDRYFNEKLKIFSNQEKDDILILNYDAENLEDLKKRACPRVLFYSRLNRTKDAYIEGDDIIYSSDGKTKKICRLSNVGLKGLYNIENILASSLVSIAAGASAEAIRDTVNSFKGLPHRFETVDIIDDVEYIDDSKGTTVDSTRRALESCERPVILIAGGKDKMSDYSAAREMLKMKAKHIILIGETKRKMADIFTDVVDTRQAETLQDAVAMSCDLAKEGDIVLLSPMCSSFDMFKNYEERGEVFKRSVYEIRNRHEKVKG